MWRNLGYEWAGSLVAFIALACCVIPFLFVWKGEAIRKFSKFAYSGDDEESNHSSEEKGAEAKSGVAGSSE